MREIPNGTADALLRSLPVIIAGLGAGATRRAPRLARLALRRLGAAARSDRAGD
jgi:hypothetical protein